MTYEFYKILHLGGLMALFFGLGGLIVASYTHTATKGGVRALCYAAHGLGLMALLVGGFGMLSKLGILSQMPMWATIKVVIWILMGLAISLAKRKGSWAWPLMILFIALGLVAGILAIYKTWPF